MLLSQGRKPAWTMQQCYGSEAQACMLYKAGLKLACFSARGASLHGPCNMLTDGSRQLACFSAKGASLHGPCSNVTDQRRKLACFETRGLNSHAFQPRGASLRGPCSMITVRGASSHACKRGAQARMLFSQGRKLAWTMPHSHG
jgi:hypothetical protein